MSSNGAPRHAPFSGRVLLVEDSDTAANFCTEVMVGLGLEVTRFSTAEKPSLGLASSDYKIVVTDFVPEGLQTGLGDPQRAWSGGKERRSADSCPVVDRQRVATGRYPPRRGQRFRPPSPSWLRNWLPAWATC